MEEARTIAISRFKATCLALLDEVKQTGRPLIITRRGIPIAKVVPPPEPDSSWMDSLRDTVTFVGDIVSPVVQPEEWDAMKE